MMELHSILLFIHTILMGYWLGGDLGVYLAANRVADPTLPIDERLRFLHLAMKLDMGPRTALIMILPTGFHMASNFGLVSLTPLFLSLIWIGSLIWLALCWAVFLYENIDLGDMFRKIDLSVRYVMLVVIFAISVWSITSENSYFDLWLSLKLFCFSIIIALGITLRIVVSKWVIGFKLLRDGSTEDANEIILSARKKAKPQALSIWALVFICGFLGATKLI